METVSLKESLIIANIVACKKALTDALEQYTDDFVLDLQDIQDCDSSGVQLLIATQKQAWTANRKIVFKNYSEPILNACTIAGIENVDQYFETNQ